MKRLQQLGLMLSESCVTHLSNHKAHRGALPPCHVLGVCKLLPKAQIHLAAQLYGLQAKKDFYIFKG